MRLHITSGRWKLGLALSLITAALWGSLPIALKILLTDMQAQTVVWYRFSVAAVLLGAGLAWRRDLRPAWPRGRTVWGLLAVASLGFSANNVLFVAGLGYVTATAGQVVIQLAPMLLLLGSVAIFKERFGGAQIAGLFLLLGGILLFFHERVGELLGNFTGYALGIVLVVLAAFAWAFYALAQKQLLANYGSAGLMWMLYASGAVLLFPLAHPAQLAALDATQTVALLYCAILTVLGYGAFAEALAHWEASRVSAVVAVTPLLTWLINRMASILMPSYVKADHLSAWSLLGAALVTVGCAFAALSRQRH
ncbi:MAG: DMT family transporter [Bryobacterales bacterium]|nr:DMT family transporter [Bryobacterales bacterium]